MECNMKIKIKLDDGTILKLTKDEAVDLRDALNNVLGVPMLTYPSVPYPPLTDPPPLPLPITYTSGSVLTTSDYNGELFENGVEY